MGLDATLKSVPADFVRDQPNVDLVLNDMPCVEEIKYWRKHGELQNWLGARYRFLGGKREDFNCATIRLFEHDIEMLLRDMKSDNMPDPSGFFFGTHDYEKREANIAFFEQFLKDADWKRFAYTYSAWY